MIFCEHKALFATKGEVPDGEHVVPLGQAGHRARTGTDCTIVALAAMVPRAVEAAERLQAEHGIDAEVIDLRTPRAARRRRRSSRRSRRRAGSSRSRRTRGCCGWGAEIVSIVADEGFYEPRRADRPDHDAARPAAVGRVARGRSRSRPSTGSSRPSGAGSRPRSDRPAWHDRRARRARGGWARPWRARSPAPACRSIVHNRSRGARGRRSPPSSARGSPASPGRGRRRRRRHPHDARRRRGRRGRVRRARRPPRGRPAGTRARRPEHRHRRTTLRAFEAAARAAGVGLLDAPV